MNGYPSGLHLGATWNKELVHETKDRLGAEFKRKGANVALGPVGGGLGRIVRGGRNWEGFSNDPFLAGALLYESVVAMQKHVVASIKHFVGNEQETNRISPRTFTVGALNQSSSSNIDDKTMHEYVPPALFNFDQTLITFTDFTCGHSRMPSALKRVPLCVLTSS